jgi:teichuronic acid biosynthesis glycosyltransferase TuaG
MGRMWSAAYPGSPYPFARSGFANFANALPLALLGASWTGSKHPIISRTGLSALRKANSLPRTQAAKPFLLSDPMRTSSPTVSAIVPCYNAQATIERCINSILAQTLPVTEILIYDDCSSDDSAQILARLAAENPQIRPIYGLENKGAAHARTTLLQAARGTFFAFLDADDLWHPTKLEQQLALMYQEDADIVVCDYDIFDVGGAKIGTRRIPRTVTKFRMHLQNEIPNSMAVLKGELVGSRAMPLIHNEDYGYWLTLFAKNPGVKCSSVPEALGSYYRMPGSLSSNRLANLKGNYHIFRHVMGYSTVVAAACVFCNVLKRIVRV